MEGSGTSQTHGATDGRPLATGRRTYVASPFFIVSVAAVYGMVFPGAIVSFVLMVPQPAPVLIVLAASLTVASLALAVVVVRSGRALCIVLEPDHLEIRTWRGVRRVPIDSIYKAEVVHWAFLHLWVREQPRPLTVPLYVRGSSDLYGWLSLVAVRNATSNRSAPATGDEVVRHN
jgi:hypothetical protein